MSSVFIEIIGFMAATLTTFSFLPQAIKTLRSKDTSGLSLVMYAAFITGIALWCLYGIFLKNAILTVSNIVTFTFAFPIFFMTLKNTKSQKKL